MQGKFEDWGRRGMKDVCMNYRSRSICRLRISLSTSGFHFKSLGRDHLASNGIVNQVAKRMETQFHHDSRAVRFYRPYRDS
jgi:hypothetical protein